MNSTAPLFRLLENFIDGLGSACLLLGPSNEVVVANSEAAQLLNLARNNRSQPLGAAIRHPELLDAVHTARDSGTAVILELFMSLPHPGARSQRLLHIEASPLKIPGVKAPHVRLLFRDCTDRLISEQVRHDLTTCASHELRTPLSVINGYLENMQEGLVNDQETLKRCVGAMRRHGERIARAVEDLLILSKVESALLHGTGLRLNSFSLVDCLTDVLEGLEPQIKTKGAQIVTQIAANAERIQGERYFWNQAFHHLLEHTLRLNNSSFRMEIRAMRRRAATIFTLTDNGVGIPKSELAQLFGPPLGDPPSTMPNRSTSLGLVIARRVIEAHHGRIGIESTPGVETTIKIELPDPPTKSCGNQCCPSLGEEAAMLPG